MKRFFLIENRHDDAQKKILRDLEQTELPANCLTKYRAGIFVPFVRVRTRIVEDISSIYAELRWDGPVIRYLGLGNYSGISS